MSKNRIEQVIDFIRSHPEMSGNQIYLYSVAHGFGIQKQNYYKIFRELKIQSIDKKKQVKKQQEKKIKPKSKSRVKKKTVKKTIPKKEIVYDVPKRTVQRKIIKEKPKLVEKDKLLSDKLTDLIEYPEDPNLEYGLIEVYDKTKKESFWIKYHDKAHLDWQIDKLEASGKRKGYTPDYDFIYHGLKDYTPFITPEFEKIMNDVGEGD